MSLRVYLTISTVEYAKFHGVTTRVARSRIQRMPGASKIGSRWSAPILATDYAKLKGIKPESARKRVKAIRARSPEEAASKADATLRRRVFDRLTGFAATRRYYNANTIGERLEHASTTQLQKLMKMNAVQWHLACYATFNGDYYAGDDWQGYDDEPILGYR